MNKTSLLTPLVFLVGVAGVFFLWNDDGVDATPIASEPVFEDAFTPARPIDVEAQPAAEEEDGETLAGLESLSREQLGNGDQAGLRYLVVQVWAGKKGVPAVETDVFFLDGFDGPELNDPYAQHWSDLAESKGRRFKTDTQGRVQLPPVQEWAMVTAQAPGRYGFTKVGRKHRKVETILLQADETVTVRVVDDQDRPVAGVPVGVVQRVPVRQKKGSWQELMAKMRELEQTAGKIEQYIRANPGKRGEAAPRMRWVREQQGQLKRQMAQLKGDGGGKGRGGKGRGNAKKLSWNKGKGGEKVAKARPKPTTRAELRARRRTDSDGIAVIRHFQVYRKQQEKWWPPHHVDRFEAVLLMPLQQAESRPFAGRPVPDETIELRLPPTGSLALRTVDLEGRPFTHPVHADLRMLTGQAVPWARVKERKAQNRELIVFPFVGLGLQFKALCRLDDDDFKWTVPQFSGPDNPGERVTIDVVVAPGEGMLFGRVLDAAGQPMAGIRPTFLINSSAGRLEGEDVVLDKAGRFHLPFQVRDSHRPPFRLEIRHDDVRPIAGLVMALQGLPRGRVTDLGDLRIEDFGRISFGTVVDDRGQPLPRARIQLQRQRDVGGKQSKLRFVDEAFVTARADAAGKYEIYGMLEAGRYRLRVEAKDHFPHESKDLRQGEQLDPDLVRKARVVGTVRTPPWLKSSKLKTVLVSAVDPKQRRDDRIRDYRGTKYIYFDWVRPGIYNLLLRIDDFPDPIMRIDGLDLQPGQVDLHPRLKDLDLGAYLHRFEIAAVDERGQAVKPGWPLLARITRPGGKTAFVGFPWKGRNIEIIHASPRLEVFPMAAGYQTRSTVLGPGVNQVQFSRIPPVELTMPGLRQAVGDALVWVVLRPDGPVDDGLPNQLERWDGRSGKISRWYQGMRRRNNGQVLGSTDTLQMELMQEGRFKVTAYLFGTTSKRKGRPVPVQLGAIDVRLKPGAGPFRVTVNVDVQKVQQALTQLAQREAAAQNK